ncbi:Mediator of RNA polymerase II transcription subunit 16 [Dermatophagoides pteronyssinus]|uniref:Mediator of RNA polymerase II transcription subunit 16 n=1 Tax=Dermatophagoides pteronyssinus TaxID=6956 RepID=A0ABQ8JLU0_DERPT|nr:Mediator of RNA polymerase II transcription subunit 16 [Dermatophagoides pteronyssinus]
MDHLYSVFGFDVAPYHRHFLEDGSSNVISSLSNNNILAFTSNFDLLDDSEENNLLKTRVYVVDLNLPYHPYRVKDHDENITVLEWDNKGGKLLIGDDMGNIEIWSMRDFLLSDWQRLDHHSCCFAGDRIIAGIWFHSGQKIMVDYDKKDLDVQYQEKFNYDRLQASVVQFGNKHTDGYLCITGTGFVYAHLFGSNGKIHQEYTILNNSRANIEQIDIAYMKNGSFLIMTSNGNSYMPIHCYTISISLNLIENQQQKLKIQCQSHESFNMDCSLLNSSNHQSYPIVSRLKFIVRECPDAAVVVGSGKNGSIIELWELCNVPVSFNNVIKNLKKLESNQSSTTMNITELKWKFNMNTTSIHYVSALSTPASLLFETTPPLSYILVAYTDKTIKCLYRQNLQSLVTVDLTATTNHSNLNNNNNNRIFHQQEIITEKLSIIRDIRLTWSSCAMVAIDSFSQLHFFRLSPMIEPCNQMSINFAQLMLEYALISGNDYWDILISVKSQFVDILCEKITENFCGSKQPSYVQQKWFDKILQLKAALYRCVNSGPLSYKSGDYYSMKMLNAIAETIKRLIRAREYQENEGPAEKLSSMIQTKPLNNNDIQQFINIDKILVKLDSKDFCVEAAIQQSFQHLLQWVCDLALYLLASIPQQCHQPQFRIPGSGLLFDVKSLNTLRELLVIIRFWSLINANYVPSFNKMHENIDVISLIYKLLSKLVLSTEKIDETIIDECCVLPNQVMIHQMDICLKSIGIASPALYSHSLPLILHYGIESPLLEYTVKVPIIEGTFNIHGDRRIDVLRNISLGYVDENTNELIRSCTRCNSVSSIKSTTRSPAARAWDQQWVKKCVCGGSWRVHASKNLSSNTNNNDFGRINFSLMNTA